MQRNFNPHVPPGFYETHELDGLSWKSEKPVREVVAERMVAQAVKRFQRDSKQEMRRQRKKNICATIRQVYQVTGVILEMVQHPWENIPCVSIKRQDA